MALLTTKKFKTVHSIQKVMATVFWDRKEIFLVEFISKSHIINAEAYLNTLKKLRKKI